jgi:putative colanic acid biosynthesis acetyltransferase WcaF
MSSGKQPMIIQGNDPAVEASFSLGNRLARAVWGTVWLLLFRTSPRPFHRWRALLLRLFGATLGRHVHVYPGVRVWAPWQLRIGDRVGIADGAIIYNMAMVSIGSNTTISQGAHLCCGSHNIDSSNFQLVTAPIVLGSHVWICADAFVAPGVSVAEGCVVGARAVLTKTIAEPWSVWVGNPAVPKRKRRIASADNGSLGTDPH